MVSIPSSYSTVWMSHTYCRPLFSWLRDEVVSLCGEKGKAVKKEEGYAGLVVEVSGAEKISMGMCRPWRCGG